MNREIEDEGRGWDESASRAFREGMDALLPADLEERTADRLRASGWGRGGRGPIRRWLLDGEFRMPVPAAVAAALLLMIGGGGLTALLLPDGGERTARLVQGARNGDEVEVDAARAEVMDLLGRARTLMVALYGARPDENGEFDLAAETEVSQDLMHRVRLMEGRSDLEDDRELFRLVEDLEAILLDVATWQETPDADRVAVLQGGIRDRSLLYRLNTYTDVLGGD